MCPENLPNLLTDIRTETRKEVTKSETDRLVDIVKSISHAKNTLENRLTPEGQIYLVSMIANCYSNAEIKQEMFQKFGKAISTALIGQYQMGKKWKPVIKKIRDEYEINVPQARLFSKRSRLDRLERIYDRAIDKGDLDVQVRTVTQGWKEIEGNKKDGETTNMYISNPIYNQLNMLSSEELMKRHKEATERLKTRSTH